jgi:endonuclease YncB( thermonuclease family)
MTYPRFIYEAVLLVEVVDGDSVKLRIDVGFHMQRDTPHADGVLYRLAGINAPKGSTPEGIAAKKHLGDLIIAADLRVETLPSPEKYGRYMVIIEARLADEWVNVNNAMLASGFAVTYHGVGKAE